MLKLKNPKKPPASYTAAQKTDVTAWVTALSDTVRDVSFDEIRAAVPNVATITDGALLTLLLDAGYVVAD